MPEMYVTWNRALEIGKVLDKINECESISRRRDVDPDGKWYFHEEPLLMAPNLYLMGRKPEVTKVVHIWFTEKHRAALLEAGIVDFAVREENE